MPSSDVISEKKKALLAYKEQILQEIKYYDSRIDDVRIQGTKNSFYENADSSDSEEEFPLTIDCGPSLPELKEEQAMLRTCLQATHELTSLQVLRFEVNVLVDDPEFEGEPPVTEAGVWREVTAECRVDLVTFLITFFVHQPDRKFGPPSYRGLRVAPVKSAHEGELSKSVLSAVTRPSDAVEVLKSYAHAQRARRSTLARLADKFASTLYMEPMADGGYILKCANLLEVSWMLQNKWSHIAPFHHRMKFDLEYMDESYIKSITAAHRQLSDPTIDTDERTLLLAKIITICLDAQGPTRELHVSPSSPARRRTLDREPEAPPPRRDTEVMAPPRGVPRKAKPKGKENMADNRKERLKRGNSNEDLNKNKKVKTHTENNENLQENNDEDKDEDEDQIIDTRTKPVKDKIVNAKPSVASNKNNEVKKADNDKTEHSNKDKNFASAKNTVDKTAKVSAKTVTEIVNSGKDVNIEKVTKEKSNLAKNNVASSKNIPATVNSDKNANKPKLTKEKSNEKIKYVANTEKKSENNAEVANKGVKEKSNAQKGQKANCEVPNKVVKDKNVAGKKQKLNGEEVEGVKEKSNSEKGQNANCEVPNKLVKDKTVAGKKRKLNSGDVGVKEKANTGKRDDETNKITKTMTEKIFEQGQKAKSAVTNKESNMKPTKDAKQAKNEAYNAKPKNPNTEGESNKVTQENAVVTSKNDVERAKNGVNTKTVEEIANTKLNNKDKDSIAIEKSKKTAKIDKRVAENVKSNAKKLPSNKDIVKNVAASKKTTTDAREAANDKPKNVASAKDKILPNKENKIKSVTKNDNVDDNIESTIEKAVEKRQSVAAKRKNNLLDRIDNIDNVASKKNVGNNTETVAKTSGITNKNVAMKRKINFIDKDSDANTKKRALNPENVGKNKIGDSKKNENFQKTARTKFESKLKTKLMPGGVKSVTASNINRVSSAGNIAEKKSMIPQKKLSSVSEATLKKNPLRISPRKISSKFKTTHVGTKSIQKITSIPRLLKKPAPKT